MEPSLRWVLSVALCVIAVGCSEPSGPSTDPASDLLIAQARWDEAGVKTYTFRLRVLTGLGSLDAQIEVDDGRVVKVVDATDRSPLAYGGHTVDDLFEIVAKNLGEEPEVSFDRDLGYPRLIWVNRSRFELDGGIRYEVSRLRHGLALREAP